MLRSVEAVAILLDTTLCKYLIHKSPVIARGLFFTYYISL